MKAFSIIRKIHGSIVIKDETYGKTYENSFDTSMVSFHSGHEKKKIYIIIKYYFVNIFKIFLIVLYNNNQIY